MSQQDKKERQNSPWVREHLANERTYLAWMRTAIALMGFGMVIVRLRYFQIPQLPRPGIGWKLGLLFSFVGLTTVFLSTLEYFAVRRAIDDNTFQPANRRIIVFSLAITLLGAGVIYFIFTAPFNPVNSFMPD